MADILTSPLGNVEEVGRRGRIQKLISEWFVDQV
jgi:hypothetical protein